MSGKIIVITAPSGSGKSTLIGRLKREFPQICESLSYTTRSKRTGEQEGKAYCYTSVVQFEEMIKQGEFLEWANVHGNYYGTPKAFVHAIVKSGRPILFEVDVQGVDALKKYFKDQVTVIFVIPPTLTVLEKRLRNRATESQEDISVRMETAKKEMERKDDFDYCLVNDNLEKTYNDLKNIIEKILEN